MRQKITLLLMCVFFAGATFAQQKRTCHAMEDLENRKRQDPTLQKRMDEIERFTQRKIKENNNTKRKISGSIITLPVVVHILYTNSTNNISTAQIQSQLDVLNADFRRTNSDRTNKWSQAADTQIEFKLATIDPNGNPTTGITRTSVSKSTWDLQNQSTSNDMKKSSRGGVDPWNTSEYLNMWIVDKLTRGSGTILGFAQFPGGAASTDGVVMADQYFGTTGTAQSPFDGGRTTTHEVGHFLNLRHIWGDGPCGSDDFVSDTPESDAANYGCKTGHTSCGSEDMVQNYMDYSDDTCMNLFTLGQKNRMRAVLEAGGSRRSLALSDKFGSGTTCNATVPTGVSTSGVTATGATVNWTAVSGATYDVRYRQAGTSSWTTNASSTTSATLSGLSASTQYQVQVRSKCSSGNSNYSASVNFTTTAVQINYCASSGNTSYATGVTRVVFGSINKADGPAKNVGYENFTNLSTTVSQSSSVNLTVSVNTDGNYRVDAIAWIDWNQDGDFADSGETYDLGNISNVSNGALPTKAVAVPANAKVGATRMRVSARYNANPTSCQTNFDGEVEDYTVNVQGAVADTQAPSAPSSLAAASIVQTTLTLNWTASTDNVGVTGYDVFRGSTKIGSTTTATSYNVTGLTANTAYSFTVKAKDAAGNVSSSSNTASVTTLGTVVNYCASKGNRVTYEWIDYVSFGGMTNTTGANGGYGDFTSKVATVAQGSTNQLIVSAGFRSTAYNEYFTIWIDYNKNGTFEASEKVASGNSSSSTNRSSNITIPSSASLGQTRMRVSMKYNAASTACETFADGEVEDYTVNITANTSKGTSISNIETLRSESGLGLMAYPNPATNFIEVNVASKSDNITYRVINTIGSVVKSGKMMSRSLNVSNLNSGIYMLEVNDGQKSLRTKFIKK
ncbi:Por secretion system C-terminal sorting domain-containing protein [Tenacibaculum sp. MAR_2010_89]|uniref:GEVED domain-containing protein n=1 Tax=Tenacibaculum sp. MAR_2010_89 TaxID=1250198 RepID=UPI000899F99A|nr:GEVED domain-containing protein [Tenacibaculum sp. MAR_2010_89]SEE01242.1 Por secretion system C-terminal sorting domain-containing protein [Tenacibaculum sp. MAR_2010_89]